MGTTMTEDALRRAEKGRQEPVAELLQQASLTEELIALHEPSLRPVGLTDVRRAAVTKYRDEVIALISSGEVQRQVSRDALHSRNREIGATKTHIRDLQQAVPMAIADARLAQDPKVSTLSPALFFVRGLGRSPAGLVQYLSRTEPHVAALDGYLKPYFRGGSALERQRSLRAALEDAEATKGAAISSLPLATQQLYEAKGHLLEAIEDINRLGRIAFNGNAVASAQFNKDLLLQGRRKKTASPVTSEHPAPVKPG